MRAMSIADAQVASNDTEDTCWGTLRETVERHLVGGGLPVGHAVRASHEIVVRCAAEMESDSRCGLAERALSEAETVLAGWRASRRTAA